MDSKQYIDLLFPDGRAFASVEDSEKFHEVLSMQIDRVLGWIQYFQDQLWYVNENFDPEIWEQRYDIEVPELATLPERRTTVKSYMSFPQSQNRLSLEYIQDQLDLAGFSDIIVSRNSTGTAYSKLHGNNVTDTESFTIGSEPYNSILISGTIQSFYYDKMILLLMSIKPLDTVVYDEVTFLLSLAYDDTLTLALDENLAFATKTI